MTELERNEMVTMYTTIETCTMRYLVSTPAQSGMKSGEKSGEDVMKHYGRRGPISVGCTGKVD